MKIDIVGGSISGLSTAITIKEFNKKIKVIVHEKNKNIGYNHEGRKCGESFGIYKGYEKWQPSNKSIFNMIDRIEFVVGEKTIVKSRPLFISNLLMLNRQEFIAELGKWAMELGVEIQINDKIKSINDLTGNYVVDASGCPSIIKRELGLNKGLIGIGYQQTLENSNYFSNNTLKYIFKNFNEIKIGYYWIFPRDPIKREINLGVGFIGHHENNLKQMLELFKKEYNITGKKNYIVRGLIPAGLQRPLMYNNILFVGDSGVGTSPFDGAGIHRAINSGVIAGKCITTGEAEQYPHIITKLFFKSDFLGKNLIYTGKLIQKINDKIYLKLLSSFLYRIYFPLIS